MSAILNRCNSNSSEHLHKEQITFSHKRHSRVLLKYHPGSKKYGIFCFPGESNAGRAEGAAGQQCFWYMSCFCSKQNFVLSTEQHKVQAGALNPHVGRRSHVGVGCTVVIFHWKILSNKYYWEIGMSLWLVWVLCPEAPHISSPSPTR